MTEVVALGVDLTSCGSTDTVLGNTVVVVVVNVNFRGFTYTGVTGIRVVIPVVVVGYVVDNCIAVSMEMNLTAIPEMVIRMSYVLRFLGVKLTVALCLVGIAACVTIEEVTVVNPDVIVVLLETEVIALRAVTVHNREVSYLYVRGGLDTDTKSVDSSVFADALKSKTKGVVIILDKKVALIECSAAAKIGNVTDKTHTDRSGISFKRACRENVGNTCVCCSVNGRNDVVLGGFVDVNYYCVCLESTVLVVCAAGGTVFKCPTASVVSQYLESISVCKDELFALVLTAAYEGYNLHNIAARG